MKPSTSSVLLILLGLFLPLLNGCATISHKKPNPAASATGTDSPDGKSVKTGVDESDDYSQGVTISDPLEPLNRGTFWVNHQFYRYILHPLSSAYDTVLPKPVRTGVFNVFDNVQFPVRFVNDSLQLNYKRAGQETGKFVVNTVAGVGGIMRVSDRIPSLANVPGADTGQTFAKWGIGHGIYIVLPILGPKSIRDTVGLAGDYALSPVTWISFGVIGGIGSVTALAISTPDSARTLHGKLETCDAITHNTLDRYLAVRTAYIQSRKQTEAQQLRN